VALSADAYPLTNEQRQAAVEKILGTEGGREGGKEGEREGCSIYDFLTNEHPFLIPPLPPSLPSSQPGNPVQCRRRRSRCTWTRRRSSSKEEGREGGREGGIKKE